MFSFSVEDLTTIGLLYAGLQLTGIAMAVHAILYARTSQGAIAWALSLFTIPAIALPLYAFFRRRKFEGYVQSRKSADLTIQKQTDLRLETHWLPYSTKLSKHEAFGQTLEQLSGMMFTNSNSVDLLVNGKATFDAIFAALDEARQYILIQFFIVHDDDLGKRLQQKLIARQRDGVQVYFLFDAIGSYKLPKAYCEEMRASGIQVGAFGGPGRFINRFQVNFRNHRKIVVVDGKSGFTGGHNVGEEYLGRHPRLGFWRDTHIKLVGPSVMGLQTAFLEDWSWVTGEFPELNWVPETCQKDCADVMVIPSGPADDHETYALLTILLLNAARERVYMTSPYFVPSEAVMEALKLAALRGVKVRIILPEIPDKRTVWYAAFAYMEEALAAGVEFFRYRNGFLHQKVILVDDDLSVVGTANLDIRSFRLNFELSVLVSSQPFSQRIKEMLEIDFAECRIITREEVLNQSLFARVAIAGSRLFSPIL